MKKYHKAELVKEGCSLPKRQKNIEIEKSETSNSEKGVEYQSGIKLLNKKKTGLSQNKSMKVERQNGKR